MTLPHKSLNAVAWFELFDVSGPSFESGTAPTVTAWIGSA